MQDITILKQVDVPNSPRFMPDQKVRVGDKLADELVERGFAKYNEDAPAKTAPAKEATKSIRKPKAKAAEAEIEKES